jgi:hypothetical protein
VSVRKFPELKSEAKKERARRQKQEERVPIKIQTRITQDLSKATCQTF